MNDALQPIRFFDSNEYTLYQKQQKNGYNYIPSLLIDRTSLLPFQLTRTKTATAGDQSSSYRQIDITTLNLINSKTNATIDLLQYLDIQYYVYNDLLEGIVTDVAVYEGNNTFTAIEHGNHYIYAKDAEDNEWYSCYLVSSIPDKSVMFQYRNSTANNYLISDNRFYWKMIFNIYTHDSGEWEETKEQLFNKHGVEYTGFTRLDKLHACEFLVDSCSYDALMYMSSFCDEIFITDENGEEKEVDIRQVTHEPQGHSNHIKILLKYTLPENQLLSTNTDTFTRYAEKKAAGSISDITELLMSHDKKIKTNRGYVKRR